jgi:hypothetical protein
VHWGVVGIAAAAFVAAAELENANDAIRFLRDAAACPAPQQLLLFMLADLHHLVGFAAV